MAREPIALARVPETADDLHGAADGSRPHRRPSHRRRRFARRLSSRGGTSLDRSVVRTGAGRCRRHRRGHHRLRGGGDHGRPGRGRRPCRGIGDRCRRVRPQPRRDPASVRPGPRTALRREPVALPRARERRRVRVRDRRRAGGAASPEPGTQWRPRAGASNRACLSRARAGPHRAGGAPAARALAGARPGCRPAGHGVPGAARGRHGRLGGAGRGPWSRHRCRLGGEADRTGWSRHRRRPRRRVDDRRRRGARGRRTVDASTRRSVGHLATDPRDVGRHPPAEPERARATAHRRGGRGRHAEPARWPPRSAPSRRTTRMATRRRCSASRPRAGSPPSGPSSSRPSPIPSAHRVAAPAPGRRLPAGDRRCRGGRSADVRAATVGRRTAVHRRRRGRRGSVRVRRARPVGHQHRPCFRGDRRPCRARRHHTPSGAGRLTPDRDCATCTRGRARSRVDRRAARDPDRL